MVETSSSSASSKAPIVDRHAKRERRAFLDAASVDPDTVAAVQVDDEVGVALGANLGVKPRHAIQRVVEDDVVAIVPSDADGVSGETDFALDGVAPKNYELRHIYLLRIPVCLGGTGGAGRQRRANAPETAESIRPVTRFTQVSGGVIVTVSSLLNAGRKSTVSSVDGVDAVGGVEAEALSPLS